jgi:hypothetical protein
MLSPHCAAWTLPEEAVADLLEALDALEAGCPPPVLVDPVRGY